MDLWHDVGVRWTAAIVLGYPLLAVALVEFQRFLRLRSPAGAVVCGLLQATVLPPLALYLLLDRVAHLPADGVPAKLLLSVLAITSINACLALLNVLMQSGVLSAEWVQRTPGLMLDLLRLFLVLVATAFVASEIWGVDLASLLTALGVGSVVLGLALQDTLSGLFAGISLMSGRHFKEGDWIEVGEVSGRIVHMNWRTVTIETLDDNRLVVIPNSELSKAQFTVLTAGNRSFGENIEVHFAYGSPPARVMAALEKAVLSVDLVLSDPPHDIDLVKHDDKGVLYEVTIHARTRKQGEEAVTEVLRKLWYICQREGLVLAGAANRLQGASIPPGLPLDETLAQLSKCDLFPAAASGFRELAHAACHELYDEGEVLLGAGDPFLQLFLVVQGSLGVSLGGSGGSPVVQRLGAGDCFITRAFLTGAPSSVVVKAEEETAVLRLPAAAVFAFLAANHGLGRRFETAIDLTELGLSNVAGAA